MANNKLPLAHDMRRSFSCKSCGMTLVEVLVAIVLAVFLGGVLATLFIANNRSRIELDKVANQIESGRYALDLIGEEIRHAGYFGSTGIKHSSSDVLPSPCPTTLPEFVEGLGYPVSQYTGTAATDIITACVGSDVGYIPGTPVLVVRRASTAVTAVASLADATNAARVFIQSIPSIEPVVNFGNSGVFTKMYDNGALAPIRAYVIKMFWLSDANGVPTLMLTETAQSGAPGFISNPVAEGIENIRYVFGLDLEGNDGVRDPIPIPDEESTEDTGTEETPTVVQMRDAAVSVRVDLLARSGTATRNYTDTGIYNLGQSVTYTPSGAGAGFKRSLFSAEFRISNILGPRVYCPNANVCI